MKTNLVDLSNSCLPVFHNDVLCKYIDWSRSKIFLNRESYIQSTTVDVSKVIGHDQGYEAMTWGYMLNNLKRIRSNLTYLREYPSYYLCKSEKDHWSFIDVDGELFIGSGKHRTTIFRYLSYFNPELFSSGQYAHGVTVIKRYLDHESMMLEKMIRLEISKYSYLDFNRINNGAGQYKWFLFSRSNGKLLNLESHNLKEFLHDLRHSTFLKRLVGKGYQSSLRQFSYF